MIRGPTTHASRVVPATVVVSGCTLLLLVALLAAGNTSFVGLPSALPLAVVLVGLGLLVTVTPVTGRFDRAARVALRAISLVLIASSCFVLLDLIQLAVEQQITDRHGRSNWLAFGQRLAGFGVGLFFWSVANSREEPRCGRCRRTVAGELRSPPSAAAGSRMRVIAWIGTASFVPYLAIHGAHAAGLAPQLDSLYVRRLVPGPPLVEWALLTVVLVGPAVFLLHGLVRRWGTEYPRWVPWIGGRRVAPLLPLVPAWLISSTLALYGWGSLVYAVVVDAGLIGLGGAASLAFAGYGTSLLTASISYRRRTRPVCLACADGISHLPVSANRRRIVKES